MPESPEGRRFESDRGSNRQRARILFSLTQIRCEKAHRAVRIRERVAINQTRLRHHVKVLGWTTNNSKCLIYPKNSNVIHCKSDSRAASVREDGGGFH